ncbi:YqhV family protein [Sulfobacillus thermosulfidooxidans]|uniref:YqhV family protein n=1 Tax=Sulfobacillus thermosulfidooxidans TaxID=28034 RepID=UPI0006B4FF41|nr:YqhV family protein [Sulfobacillus thermosulfidooxidans]
MSSDMYLKGMVLIRLISASIEFTGAFLMWRYQRLDMAVRINGLLGLAGPIILTTTMLLGIAGLAATKVPVAKIAWIGAGVVMILWGTTR